MHTHLKIFVLVAYNFEKMPKMGFRNVADVYSKSHKTKLMVKETSNMAENYW